MIPLLLIAACADLPTDLPTAASPPPLTLITSGAAVAGSMFGFQVDGAPPGAPVILVASTGGIAVDQGYCPPVLAGGCLDILPGATGYRAIAGGPADAAGRFEWSIVLPPTFPAGTRYVQAIVADPAQPAEAFPLEISFTSICLADAEEPNDNVADAAPLLGDLVALTHCGDDDYYVMSVDSAQTIEVTASYLPGDGNLELELLSATGQLLDGSYRLTGTEIITWYNATAAPVDVYLRAYSVTDPQGDGVRYGLDYDETRPAACVEDGLEDNDIPAAAVVLTPAFAGAQVCVGDADWYVTNVAANERISVTVLEPANAGDVDATLYDGLLRPVSNTQDTVVWDANTTGPVYIEVRLITDDVGGGGNSYGLSVSKQARAVCAADALEPNNTDAAAATISVGVATGLQLCSDDDWFTFYVQSGLTVDLTAIFQISDGDIDFEVFGPTGRRVANGTDAGDNEVVSFGAPQTGTYLVRAYLYSDYGPPNTGGANYDFTLDVR